MKTFKSIIAVFFIALLCLNADCNKIEGKVNPNSSYIIEGRLVNSCTDNSPLKNRTFELRDENDKIGTNSISVKTDSNGYFKIYSNLKGKNLIMDDGLGIGKDILLNLPGGKNLSLGNVAYNFTIPVTLIYKKFKNISSNDSLRFQYSGGNPNVWKYYKGPLLNENVGLIYINSTPMFNNIDSITGIVSMTVNGMAPVQTKKYLITPCGVTHELIFE